MTGRLTVVAALATLLSTSAWAQDHRFEVGGNAGWTFSDGVTTEVALLGGDGNIYDRIDPKDSFSWGLNIGYFLNEQWELEFIYSQQPSTLEVSGPTATREIGDFSIKNYHGVFSYHWGETDAHTRPYLFLGAGATSYPGLNFTTDDGQNRNILGSTKFSGTLGLGVKVYPGSGKAGLRLQARWTPTYIKSDSEGYWCDPYWGCYVVGDAQYSNQYELTGGISLRF